MSNTQTIHCPNCGNHARRRLFPQLQIAETACPVCDYLLVNCVKTGNVVDSYVPGVKQAFSLP